jgi:hypothetical protein
MANTKKQIPELLPRHIESITGVSQRHRPLYDIDPNRDGYTLTPSGGLLQRYREAVAGTSTFSAALTAKRPSRLSKIEWSTLLSVAQPEERPTFLREAAAGRIKIEG